MVIQEGAYSRGGIIWLKLVSMLNSRIIVFHSMPKPDYLEKKTRLTKCESTVFTKITNSSHGPGEFRGSRGLCGCRGRTKNPPNTKSAEFILTLGENEFRGLRGLQSGALSVEFVTQGNQQCISSFSTYTAIERF